MGDAVTHFIEPILAVVPTPKTESQEGFIGAYAKVLSEFDDDVLALAADVVIRTLKHKSMPLPAECLDACREAADTIRLRKLRAAQPRRKIPEQFMWTAEMAKNADRLFGSAWGRKAVEDGIELAVWDFMVKQQRWPNGTEYDNIKKASLARQAETRDFLRIQQENGGIKPDALAWLNTMKSQSGRLKNLALAGQ